ncbi:MAG: hypothetical protein ACXW20_17585 [Burkholderiales bacterium]
MGYKAMHVSQGGMRPSMQAAWDYAVDLRARGAQAEVDFEKRSLEHPLGGFHEFAGFGRFKELEAKYLPVEEVKKRYDGSEGLYPNRESACRIDGRYTDENFKGIWVTPCLASLF